MGEGSAGSYTIVSMMDGLLLTEKRNSKRMLTGFPNDDSGISTGTTFEAEFIFIGEPYNGPAYASVIKKIKKEKRKLIS